MQTFPDRVLAGEDRFFAAAELIHASGTAIGATLAALTAVTGDSLAVKNAPLEKPVRILQLWCDVQVAGTVRVRSPKFHDNVQGIRYDTVISDPRPLFPWGISQRIFPNDVLTVELTIATGTAGGYSGSEAINVEFDQFHAGGQYALVGYTVDTECCSVGWRGADTGNLRIGGPGDETERELTGDWFVRLSRASGYPCIPVFSAENKGASAIDAVQDENGADVTVNSIFVELAR